MVEEIGIAFFPLPIVVCPCGDNPFGGVTCVVEGVVVLFGAYPVVGLIAPYPSRGGYKFAVVVVGVFCFGDTSFCAFFPFSSRRESVVSTNRSSLFRSDRALLSLIN